MKTRKSFFAVLLALVFTVAAFSSLFAFDASAASDGFARHVTLNVADGAIRIYSDRYVQNDVVHEGFSSETTLYTITGVALYSDALVRVIQDAEDVPVVTFHVVFRDLYITPATWCSVVHFKSYQPDPEEGAPSPMTVDLRLEGRNRISGYNHPGISGNAVVNLSAAPDSRSVFTAEYNDFPNGFDGTLTLHQVGEYEVKVNDAVADLDAGKTAKPVVITGQDSVALVTAMIDALPAAAEVGLSDKAAIASARAAYDALSDEKQEMVAAAVLQHLSDDEAALAAAEAAASVVEETPAPKPKRNLTALWIVLGFLGGAGCAAAVTLFVLKKKPTLSWDDAEPETDHSDTAD